MRHLTRNILLQSLMILALVTAGVSPACAFISGKMTLIEICGVDGLTQVVVPADQAPSSPDPHSSQPDCGFCIAQGGTKALTTAVGAIIDFSYVYAPDPIPAVAVMVQTVFDRALPARGPPVFL